MLTLLYLNRSIVSNALFSNALSSKLNVLTFIVYFIFSYSFFGFSESAVSIYSL